MAKIVINIDMDELQSGINQVVDDDMYEMEEVEFVCPLPTERVIEVPVNSRWPRNWPWACSSP